MVDGQGKCDALTGGFESDRAVKRVENIVLYRLIDKDHNYLLFGLDRYIKELFRLGICRSAGADNRSAARSELLCRIHNGIGKACVYYTKYGFVIECHNNFLSFSRFYFWLLLRN